MRKSPLLKSPFKIKSTYCKIHRSGGRGIVTTSSFLMKNLFPSNKIDIIGKKCTQHTTTLLQRVKLYLPQTLDNMSFSLGLYCLQSPVSLYSSWHDMKSEFCFVTWLCLLLAPGIKTDLLNIENSFLEARLNSLNGTYKADSLGIPWLLDTIVDLMFNFITPYGPGVSEKCSISSIAYKDALNNVSWIIVV